MTDYTYLGKREPEIDQRHVQRVRDLLVELTGSHSVASPDLFLAAYRAVLEKDLLWAMNDLLAYKQTEIHQ
jgi:hypothetical protein